MSASISLSMAQANIAFKNELNAIKQGATLPEDGELVARVLEGDGASFELIMRRYNRRLFRLARSILRNDADAEDTVQDAYIKAYTRLSTFRGPSSFPAWLSKIVVNEALGRRRRPTRLLSLEDYVSRSNQTELSSEFTSNTPGPERLMANSEIRTLLEKAVDALPDDFRTVFVLRDIEGLSVAETAACLSIRQETVKTRLFRARRRLQKSLGEQLSSHLASTFEFGGTRCDRMVTNVFEQLQIRRIR